MADEIQEVHLLQGNAVVVTNLDELSDDLAKYLKDGVNVNVGDVVLDTSQLQKLLEQINDKIPKAVNLTELTQILKDLNVFVKDIGMKLGIEGEVQIYGQAIEVPAIKDQYSTTLIAKADGFITGVTYSQSCWNYEDNWILKVNDKALFNNIYTKEYGESKHFSNVYPIKQGDKISFIYNNNSSSNKIVWIDFELLEKETRV